MPRARAEWGVLRGALGVFAVSVVIAGLLLWSSDWFWRGMHAEYTANFAQFRAASRQYLAVDDEERIIEAQYPAFRALHARGVIGPERRLSWVEAVRTASGSLGLPALDYRIDAQQAYTPEVPLASAPFDLRVSEMQISAALLHEGDLARLFAHLEARGEGLFSVERCELRRADSRPADTAGGPTAALQTECVLRWFTLAPPAGTGVD
ncbi:MAG: hypothetical protein AB7O21_10350 [Gammaproteobacteria bacterium]